MEYINRTPAHWSYTLAGPGHVQARNNSIQAGGKITWNSHEIGMGLGYKNNADFHCMNMLPLAWNMTLFGRKNDNSKISTGIAHDGIVGRKGFSYTTGSTEIGFVYDQSTCKKDPKKKCKFRISGQSACPIHY